jgi:hypothetical protein
MVTSIAEELAGSAFGVEVACFSVKFVTTYHTAPCYNCEDHCPYLKFRSGVKKSLMQCWV